MDDDDYEIHPLDRDYSLPSQPAKKRLAKLSQLHRIGFATFAAGFVTVVLAAIVLGGCDGKTKDENALLHEENESLRAQLTERNSALDSAYDENRQLTMQVSGLRREIDDLEAAMT